MKMRTAGTKTVKTVCFLLIAFCLVYAKFVYAASSTITEAEGYACMGEDKSRKQTEQKALSDAQRKASEYAQTYLKSETRIKDLEVEKDLVSAYADAKVRVIQELERGWYKDPSSGDCYRVRIKAEVIPDEKAMNAAAKGNIEDPDAPLAVSIWTDKKEYKTGDKIKVYLKGNKPFFASVLYKDVSGGMLQLLPNPYRADNYFNGGIVYELPSGNDKYELEVSPPFGEERIIIYASTSPPGELDLAVHGGVYRVNTKDAGARTRAVNIQAKTAGKGSGAAEFFEVDAAVKTRR